MVGCRRLATLVVAAFALAATSAAPAEAKEVLVDCTKASIQDALGDKAADLTIVVKGWCNEHVIVRRPVVLRGFSGDPSLDGIQGPGAGADIALVHVQDVPTTALAAPTPEGQSVVLQDVGIRDSERAGLFTAHASLGLRNVRITGNATDGGSFTYDSFVVAIDADFIENGAAGFNVRRTAVMSCSSCEISDNGGFGVIANNDGIAALFDGTAITGARGAAANNDGHLIMDVGTSVDVTGPALRATTAGDIDLAGVTVGGEILCAIDGRFTYIDMTQTSNPGTNHFFAGCNFFGEGDGVFAGHTSFEGPIVGVAYGPMTFDTLSCDGPHSDLICHAGATHTSSTCGSCP
jgi:hypothetical protein